MARSTARQLAVQAAMDAAENNELIKSKEYSVQESTRQFTVGVPPIFLSNTAFGKGANAQTYIDFEREMIVYDFGGDSDEC